MKQLKMFWYVLFGFLCNPSYNHQPVMVFEDDPFLADDSDDSYADILTDGVRQGLFEDSDSSDPASSGVGWNRT